MDRCQLCQCSRAAFPQHGRARLQLVGIEKRQHPVQRLRSLRGQRVHRFPQLGGELLGAFSQTRKLQALTARLQRDFIRARVELDVVDIRQPPLKTLGRCGQHREIALVESNLEPSPHRRPTSRSCP